MDEVGFEMVESKWPIASRKRRLLAGCLDYLLFGAPWTIAVWYLSASLPQLQRASLPLRLLFFMVLEALLVGFARWSPGHFALGIVASHRSPFASPVDPSGVKPTYLVEPWLLGNERWWTVLLGVLVIMDGAKTIVRWTMWHVPVPIMGTELSEHMSVFVQILLGAAYLSLGVAILRLKPYAVPIGLTVFGFEIASMVMSWSLMPAWVEQYVYAHRLAQGGAPRPGEIEFMRAFVPIGTIIMNVVASCWLLCVGYRSHRARAA